jgi:putative addiction module component (TIGR02574 family)
MTKEEIQKLLELPAEERLELAQALWQSLEADVGALPVTEAQRAVLDERLEAFLAQPNDVLTWSEVKAKLSAV